MTIRSMAMSDIMVGRIGVMQATGQMPQAPQFPGRPGANQNNQATTNQAIREFGRDLQSAVSEINRNRGAIFNAVEGNTANNNVATVDVDNSRTIRSMFPQDVEITVQQTALAQVNEGEELLASGRDFQSGTQTFEIESRGQTHSFTINVLDSDTNASIQNRMADLINSRNIGINATVSASQNNNQNYSQLNLTSQTGSANAFEVRDTVGNLAGSLGVTDATQEARNARFSVNGGFERVSASNEVNIAAGVTATLQGEGTTRITFSRDQSQQTEAVTNLVNQINDALRGTRAADGRGSERFIQDLAGMNRTFQSSLGRVGIDVQANGTLQINETRLNQAARDGTLGNLFENRNIGFGARVERIASNAANTNFYQNAPAPVNFTARNSLFDFGNMGNTWNMINIFG